MTDPSISRIGGVLSADIAVPEHERELRFYSRVLTTGDSPLWREDLMNNQGTPIIGLGARIPAYAHLPLQWMPHIQVADVAASARRAVELGGSEVMHGKDDEGRSQWAVLQDPDGAAFGIIPLVAAMPSGVELSPSVGRICEIRLTVSDASAARSFYENVVGWSSPEVEDGGGVSYALGDGLASVRISQVRGDKEGLPAVWLLALPVSDLEESLRRVAEDGGRVVHVDKGRGGPAAYAAIQDPIGAHLALLQA